MTTTFNISNAAQLASAIAEISTGGASAAGNTTYTFNFQNGFTLDRQLAPISLVSTSTLTIHGGGFTMDGANTFGGFMVMSGSVSIDHLTIANTVQRGGDGEDGKMWVNTAGGNPPNGGGGGGAGLGGGLFVAAGANVTLDTVSFSGSRAVGGDGGDAARTFPTETGSPHFAGGGQLNGVGALTAAGTDGSFGDGGGGSVVSGTSFSNYGGPPSGDGGFGGGGGGGFPVGYNPYPDRAEGGWGGGIGGFYIYAAERGPGGGGGGLGAGGAIFVQEGGSLTIAGAGSISGGSATGGARGYTTPEGYETIPSQAGAGMGAGSGLFLQGNQSLTFAPAAGVTQTISDTIADQGYFSSAAYGYGKLVLNGLGALVLAAANQFGGGVLVNDGTLSLLNTFAAGSGAITLRDHGTLRLGAAIDPTNIIKGFDGGDSFSFTSYSATSVSFNYSTNVLQVTNGSTTRTLYLDPTRNYAGTHFVAQSDGSGGTKVTLGNLLTNGDFDSTDLSNGASGVVVEPTGGNYTQTAPTGWVSSGSTGTQAPVSSQLAAFAADSNNVAFLNAGASLSQTFNQTGIYRNYDFAVDIGRRTNVACTTGVVKMYAGTDLIAQQAFDTTSLTPGTVLHLSLSGEILAGHLGQAIKIDIQNTGAAQIYIDNAVAAAANALDAPTIAVAGWNFAVEGGAPVTVLSGAPAITSSIGTLDRATVWLTDFKAGDLLAAATAGTAISANYANGVLTLSGTDTIAHYTQVLASVTYQDTGHDTTTVGRPYRHFAWSIDDGTLNATASTQTEVAINRVSPATNTAAIPGVASYVGNITQSAPDYDGDGVTVISFEGSAANVGSVMQGDYGALLLNGNGSYQYVPSSATLLQVGVKQDSFTYTVQDSTGQTVNVAFEVLIVGPRISVADLVTHAAAIAANPSVPVSIVDSAANIAANAAVIDLRMAAGQILSTQVIDGSGNLVSITYHINSAEDLNAALAQINQGGDFANAVSTFTFEFLNGFTLDRQLTPINLDGAAKLVINGNGFTMNGADTYGGFVAMSGDINIDDLVVSHTTQHGGNGGSGHYGGAGGGGGFGGGLLVFADASVELGNVAFDGNRAIGGNGGVVVINAPPDRGGQLNGFLGDAEIRDGRFGGGGGTYYGSGANGGFGGGGGGSSYDVVFRKDPHPSAFGGGIGYIGGGGGAGLGGAIFVQEGGSLSFTGSTAISGGAAIGGTGGTIIYDGLGAGLGSGIFLQGDQTLTFSPATGETVAINSAIYVQTGGAIVLDGPGTLMLGAANSVATTTIESGTLALLATGAAGNGTLTFAARTNGTLVIGANADVGNTIVGFDSTHAIDLAGYGGSVRFRAAPNSNVLQVTNGTLTETLTFDHTVNAFQFVATSDGNGGALITLANMLSGGNFQTIDLSNGGAGVTIDAVHGNSTATAPLGWTATGSVGAIAPTAAVSPDFANSKVAYLNGGASLSQTFAQDGDFYQYQISLDLGRRLDDTTVTTGVVKVYAGSDLIGTQSFDTSGIAPGAVSHLSLTTSGLVGAQFTQPIRVEIDNTGSGQVLLDNVLAAPQRPLVFEITSARDFNDVIAGINSGGPEALANIRYTLNFANSFTLDRNLDTINLLSSASITINGGGFTIDGANAFGSFEITSGTLEINDLTINDTVARGGDATTVVYANGGGGAGVGGGLFVGAGTSVALSNVHFSDTAAVGGNGHTGFHYPNTVLVSPGGAGSVPGATFAGTGGSISTTNVFATGGNGGGINGWGGGAGTTGAPFASGGSGGGGAFGGAIFVQDGGSLSIAGNLDISGGSVASGQGFRGGRFGGAYGEGIFLADNRPLTLAPGAGAVQTISSVIDDQYDHGRLVLDGRGTLVLATANLFGGGVTINSGTLSLGTATSAGSGGITFGVNKSGTLELAAGFDIANLIAGFTSNDIIRLVGFGTATSFSFGADSVLTVGNGTSTITLEFDPLGGLVASQLTAVSDGSGGTLITFVNLLTDGNFQAVDLSNGGPGVIVDAVLGNRTTTAPSGWTGSGAVGTLAPTAAVSGALESNVATLGSGASMSQAFAAPGDYNNYDIELDIGRRLDDTAPTTGVVKVYAGSTLIDTYAFDTSSIAPGATAHIAFTSDGVGVANLDQPIRIEIENTGSGKLLVDNVFAASANPAPTATMSVVAGDVHSRTVQFNVTFSSSVTGVDANAFSIVANGIAGATVTGITQTDAAHYVVTVTAGTVTDSDGIASLQLVLNPANVTSVTGAPWDSRNSVSASRDVSNVFVIADAEDFNAAVAMINAGGAASAANAHYVFDIQDGFTLDRSLTHIQLSSSASLTIRGHDETLDGVDAFGGLMILSGTVSVEHLTLSRMKATGGEGESGSAVDQIGGGGGGAGLGGALFVGAGASVTLDTVDFAGNQAIGGAGGSSRSLGSDYFWDWTTQIGGGGGLNGGDGGAFLDLQSFGFVAATFGGGGLGAGVWGPGADGGFGGGGGGWAPNYGITGGASGWGAGSGGNITAGDYPAGGGGGGLGAGGAVFVQQGGSLTIRGNGAVDGGTVTGGTGGGDGAQNGSAFGSGLFLQGNQSLTFAPATGEVLTIADVIADQAGSITTTAGAGSLILDGAGTLVLSAANTFTGGVTIKGGTLSLAHDAGAGTGAITFAVTAAGTLHLAAGVDIDNVIKGFNADDKLDLAGFGVGMVATLNASNVLTVTNGSTVETFQLDPAGSYGAYLAYVTADGSGGSFVTIALNGGPSVTLATSTYAATERQALTLTGTGLSVADIDDVGARDRITLAVGQGQLDALAGNSGVTIISGNGSASLVIEGTIAQLNSFLAGSTTGALSYTNFNDNPDTSTTLTLKVDDRSNTGGILSATGTATINITPVNNAPIAVIAPTSYAATEQTVLSLKNNGLTVNDVDGNLAIETVTLQVSEGALTVTAGDSGATVSDSGTSTVTITGTLAQIDALLNSDTASTISYINNSDTPSVSVTLTLKVSDGGSTGGGTLIASDSAIIAIAAVNDAPVLGTNTAPTLAEGSSITITAALLDFSDVDNTDAQLVYTITAAAGHGVLMRDGVALGPGATFTQAEVDNNRVTYTHGGGEAGSDQFVFSLTDGTAAISGQTFAFNITPVNDAPVATNGTASGNEDSAITGALAALDAEGAALTYVRVAQAAHGTVVVNTDGTFTYTPTADFNGTDSFSFRVHDGSLNSNVATVTVTVNAVNDAPVAQSGTAAGLEDTAITGVLAVTDVDNATLTYAVTAAAAHGTVVIHANGTYTYTPTANFNGTDSFSFKASDGSLETSIETISLTIGAVNDAPVNTVPGTQSVHRDADLVIAGLLIADADAGAGTMSTTLSVIHGTLTIVAPSATVSGSGTDTVTLTGTRDEINAVLAAANNVVYRSAAGFLGEDKLTITTADNGNAGAGGPLRDTDTFAIKVVDPMPVTNGTPLDDTFTAADGPALMNGGMGIDTIAFNFKLTDATISWSGNQVIVDTASSHTVLTGFERYVFTDGTVDNNDGNPLVDDLFYYSKHRDVWSAHVDADNHYSTAGWREGRDPSAFFSTSLYLSANPDVKSAGVNPLTHFDQYGWQEGRVPSLAFDARAYLAANPDVAAAHVDPLAHFLASGAQEGRQPIAAAHSIAANGFNFVYYLQHNPDVVAAGVDPLQHFMTTGWHEGRNPNALFDVTGYLAAYTDVAAAGVNPLAHYHQYGWAEGRDPSVSFDTTAYLAANPDVAAAHVDPLAHFLQFGTREGRMAFADGVWG